MKKELLINIALGLVAILVIVLIISGYKPVQTNESLIQLSDFSTHASTSDCWIRINGNIYDVTSYLTKHPGGETILLPYCGGPDATDAFVSKGGRGSHSETAENVHTQILVGILSK